MHFYINFNSEIIDKIKQNCLQNTVLCGHLLSNATAYPTGIMMIESSFSSKATYIKMDRKNVEKNITQKIIIILMFIFNKSNLILLTM